MSVIIAILKMRKLSLKKKPKPAKIKTAVQVKHLGGLTVLKTLQKKLVYFALKIERLTQLG